MWQYLIHLSFYYGQNTFPLLKHVSFKIKDAIPVTPRLFPCKLDKHYELILVESVQSKVYTSKYKITKLIVCQIAILLSPDFIWLTKIYENSQINNSIP